MNENMNDNLRTIDRLSAAHKEKAQKVETLEKAVNDATLISELDTAKDKFVPGRFDQGKSLQLFEDTLENIRDWMSRHFDEEESLLLKSVEQYGDRKLISALNSLLLEHAALRSRLVQAKEHVIELKSGSLSHHRWNASANDLRAHISHTRKLMEAHMLMENQLFSELRRHFKEAAQKRRAKSDQED
jgi:iron-sulfur cluster repair protein YtfE (RIC family)